MWWVQKGDSKDSVSFPVDRFCLFPEKNEYIEKIFPQLYTDMGGYREQWNEKTLFGKLPEQGVPRSDVQPREEWEKDCGGSK